ncbi:MAG: hypothetical protein ACXV2D_05140 [Halobacteriota archaeon]
MASVVYRTSDRDRAIVFISASFCLRRRRHVSILRRRGTLLVALCLVLGVLSLVTFRGAGATPPVTGLRATVRHHARSIRASDLRAQYLLILWLVTVNAVPLIASSVSSIKYVDRYTIAASVALYLLVARE